MLRFRPLFPRRWGMVRTWSAPPTRARLLGRWLQARLHPATSARRWASPAVPLESREIPAEFQRNSSGTNNRSDQPPPCEVAFCGFRWSMLSAIHGAILCQPLSSRGFESGSSRTIPCPAPPGSRPVAKSLATNQRLLYSVSRYSDKGFDDDNIPTYPPLTPRGVG
jgi:hypothetical protein